MIDISTLIVPQSDMIPEPTVGNVELFNARVVDVRRGRMVADSDMRIIASLARRCRELDEIVVSYIVDNYELIADQTESAARIAELESEVEQLKQEIKDIERFGEDRRDE